MIFSYNTQNQVLSWQFQDGFYQIGHLENGTWNTIYSGTNLSMQTYLSSGNQVLARKTSDPSNPPLIPPTASEYNAIAETIYI